MADQTHETKIVVGGDASGASNALNGIKALLTGGIIGALHKVKTAIAGVMSALGVFGMAMQGIQVLIEGYKKLNEWMNRAARAAAQMRIASIFRDASNAMDSLISKQKIYNSLLQKELADLQRRNELNSIETNAKYRREDERREIDRANELAVAAGDPDKVRSLQQRYAVEDEKIRRARETEKLDTQIRNEQEKAAIYGSKARGFERAESDADSAAESLRADKIRMSPEQQKEADKQIAALKEKAKASRESAALYSEEEKQAEKRAELYRAQRDEIRNAPSVAEAKNRQSDAEKQKSKDEKQKSEDEKKKQREQNVEDKTLEKMKQDDLAQLNPSSPNYERDKREIERKYEIKALENKRDRATNEEDRKAAGEELEAIGIRHERERREERASLASGLADRAASFDGVSQNRLTALGLGSGVSASGKVADDVRKIVDLLKQEVDESRKANQQGGQQYAVYGD